MNDSQPQDSRGYFMLPQGCEGGGYYTYGTPSGGRFQYAHPQTITLIHKLAFDWSALDGRPFGVGNISLAAGPANTEHHSHKDGLQIDIRPLRKDGRKQACTIFDPQYDREATARLIALFFRNPLIQGILFNDNAIPRVSRWDQHDDHFHVQVKR